MAIIKPKITQDVFLNKFITYLRTTLNLNESERIVLAVSGGVDSIVLLDLMDKAAKNLNFELQIAHYNHQLRGKASIADEQFVHDISIQKKLKYHSSKGKVKEYAKKNSLSIEHAARILRYFFLERVARSNNIEIVATAHNFDDSIETFFLNLFRGSGLTGLSGIRAVRPLGKKVLLMRPLIWATKQEIIEYANKNKLKWHEDESNELLNYTRNKLRLELLPLIEKEFNPALKAVIGRTMNLLVQADDFIGNSVQKALPMLIIDAKQNYFSLNLSNFITLDSFLQAEIIQFMIENYILEMPVPLQSIDRVLKLLTAEVGSVCEINKDFIIIRDRDALICTQRSDKPKDILEIQREGEFRFADFILTLKEIKKKEMKFSNNPLVEYFDYELVPFRLKLRRWQPGDSFTPLGMDGTVKVSNFLVNEKVSLIEKQNISVLCSKSDILWICGKRINNNVKVTDLTKRILRAEIKKIDNQN
ncbi:MAG: tRNA lysidine(34) synthetase TilS [Candidatus Kapabacteria bacterium]|nr:tRNA lysidine(34) synthetase TilS [Candidatus Kapabacteria bacterium]